MSQEIDENTSDWPELPIGQHHLPKSELRHPRAPEALPYSLFKGPCLEPFQLLESSKPHTHLIIEETPLNPLGKGNQSSTQSPTPRRGRHWDLTARGCGESRRYLSPTLEISGLQEALDHHNLNIS